LRKISSNFSIITNEDDEEILISEKIGIAMRIRKNGHVPKSGILMAEQLCKLEIKGKTLDIGTGETGILANCLLALGASEVFASDIDPKVIRWARQASNRSSEIHWHNCDLFPENRNGNKFRNIISNPPQMPMPTPGSLHDYGGTDGREIILRILQCTPNYLKKDGYLFLLCFDFLGVDNRYNSSPTLVEIASSQNLKCEIITDFIQRIRKGGKTEENINWINHIYPYYVFKKDANGNTHYKIKILKFTYN